MTSQCRYNSNSWWLLVGKIDFSTRIERSEGCLVVLAREYPAKTEVHQGMWVYAGAGLARNGLTLFCAKLQITTWNAKY